MKTKVYLRIAKTKRGFLARADKSLKSEALESGAFKSAFPTIRIALNLEIDDQLFDKAEKEISLKILKADVCSDIKVEQKIGEIK